MIRLNGRKVITGSTPVKVVYPHQRVYTAEFEKFYNIQNEMFICSDSLETHSFLYDLKHSDIVKESSFQLVKDFEFSPQERNLSSSYRELLSVMYPSIRERIA